MNLYESIRSYIPCNEQEEHDKNQILLLMESMENLLSRENTTAHFTASAWVVSPDRSKVLMAYHNIYHSWAWLGGHADGDSDLLKVAMREVKEESSITHVRPLSEEIFSLETLTVDGHIKNGAYVSSHLHLNLTYLLEASTEDPLSIKEDENSGVKWFSPQKALEACSEPWMVEYIYKKLILKTSKFTLQ